MSHELRTPLNAIIGFSDVLIEEIFGPLGNKKQREYLGNIKESGADLLRVKQILINLLSNAVKFTPQGTTVSISFPAERVGKGSSP